MVAGGGRLVYAPDVVVGHPSRSSWRELGRKSVRVANGIADRTQHLGRRALAHRAYREARGGLTIWMHVWRGSRPVPTAITGKVRYAAAFSYVRALRVAVHVRRLARH